MTAIELFQRELENEALTTKKMLSIVPADKFDWQPHPRSMKLKNLVVHIAELPTWLDSVLKLDGIDFANTPYSPVAINSTEELLEHFEKSLEKGRNALAEGHGVDLMKAWKLHTGDIIHIEVPKLDMLRQSMSQVIHHRAQLGVYLRLLDVKIPGSYGPSADEGF